MRPVTGVRAEIGAQLAIGRLGRVLGHQADAERAERPGEGDRRLKHAKPEVLWADQSPPLPLRRQVRVGAALGKHRVDLYKPGDRLL